MNPEPQPPPRVLIGAGPTAEDIDPVRFITNRSTGRMGIETAAAVKRAGGTPLLVLGPTHLEPPPGVETVRVRSASDMCRAIVDNLDWCQALVMTAAVADYTPAEPLNEKLRKKEGDLLLRLKRTPDILATVGGLPARKGKFVIGFSLDVDLNVGEGERKLERKNLDMIVVNTSSSFGAGKETAVIIGRDFRHDCGEIGKENLADILVSHIMKSL